MKAPHVIIDDPHPSRTNTKLAMLAALAVGMQRLPESARDVVNQPRFVRKDEQTPFVHPKDRKPNTVGLNRKTRRRLASLAAHGKLHLKGKD